MYDVTEPKRIFFWAKEAVDADIKDMLNSLVKKKNNDTHYPNFKEILGAIEEYLEITQNDKCSNLKAMKIRDYETIKTFNHRYRKLYNHLEYDYRKIVSIEDYLNAIKSRKYSHSQVIISECETLSEAFKVAEMAEKAERKTMSEDSYVVNNGYNVNMLTQNPGCPSILSHPIYSGFMNNNTTNFNGNYNNYSPSFNSNNRFDNFHNPINYNGYNASVPFPDNNNNRNTNYRGNTGNYYIPYDNGNNITQSGFIKTLNYVNKDQFGNVVNYGNGTGHNFNNLGTINSNMLPNNNMNTNMAILAKNNNYEYGNINSFNNSNNGNFYTKQPQNGNIKLNQNSHIKNNYNHRNDNRNYRMNNNNLNGNTGNATMNRNSPMVVQCYRCKQYGHKAFICPYSMEEINNLLTTNKGTTSNDNTNNENAEVNKPLNSN